MSEEETEPNIVPEVEDVESEKSESEEEVEPEPEPEAEPEVEPEVDPEVEPEPEPEPEVEVKEVEEEVVSKASVNELENRVKVLEERLEKMKSAYLIWVTSSDDGLEWLVHMLKEI